MRGHLFMEWLDSFLSEGRRAPVPLKDFSRKEALLAEKIQAERRKADTFQRYSKVYLDTLHSTEQLYEMSIRSLSALAKISESCETSKNAADLCSRIVEIFSLELEFENCSIMLIEPGGKHLRLVAGKGKGDKYYPKGKRGKRHHLKVGDGIAGRVAKSGEYILIPDVSKDNRFKKIDMDVHVTTLMAAPLKSGGKIIGVMNFSHPLLETFDNNKIHLLLLLSNLAAHMITLAGLRGKLTEWNKLLEREVESKTAELLKKNRELHRIAVTDSLTGIYNRRFFFMRLEEEFSRSMRYGEPSSLLIIDLDNLKPINDLYGHIEGDRVIKGMAKFLKEIGRKGDVIGRIGGDEFGYILLNAEAGVAHAFASRVKEEFKKLKFKGVEIKTTISIGIASTPDGKFKRYQDLYKAADDALYLAKKKRDSITVFGGKKGEAKQKKS